MNILTLQEERLFKTLRKPCHKFSECFLLAWFESFQELNYIFGLFLSLTDIAPINYGLLL